MPRLIISKAERNKFAIIRINGWYGLEITGYKSETAKDKVSTNHVITVKVNGGQYVGKTADIYFSEKALATSANFFIALGAKEDAEGNIPVEFSAETIVGKTLDGYSEVGMYQPTNKQTGQPSGAMRENSNFKDYRPFSQSWAS